MVVAVACAGVWSVDSLCVVCGGSFGSSSMILDSDDEDGRAPRGSYSFSDDPFATFISPFCDP